MTNFPQLINDPRLTPDMGRMRNGATQLFRRRGLDNHFTSEQNADVVLVPPSPHIFAELRGNEWYWVNGCGPCNGEVRSWATYIECEQHNVCRTCGTHRSALTEIPWGGSTGWQCAPCAKAAHEERKAVALAAMPKKFNEMDYWREDEIRCPYCNAEHDSSEMHGAIDRPEDITCDTCDNAFELSGEVEVKWTMKRKTGVAAA